MVSSRRIPEFIVDPPFSGIVNMARDQQLLEQVESSAQSVTFIRFYQWEQPTVSLGQNQKPSNSFNLEYCLQKKIPFVHRPTGGRTVFHADEVTYAVVSNDIHLFGGSIRSSCHTIGASLRAGLRNSGIPCNLAPDAQETTTSSNTQMKNPCFASPSRYELMVFNRKIVGSAQRRLKRGFLQHGSIPLRVDYFEIGRILNFDPIHLKQRMISVEEAAGRLVSFEELVESLTEGFIDTL